MSYSTALPQSPALRGDGVGRGGARPMTGTTRAAAAILTNHLAGQQREGASAATHLHFDGAKLGKDPRARRLFNDNAHADRRAPPGRNPGGGRQGKPDRGI